MKFYINSGEIWWVNTEGIWGKRIYRACPKKSYFVK